MIVYPNPGGVKVGRPEVLPSGITAVYKASERGAGPTQASVGSGRWAKGY